MALRQRGGDEMRPEKLSSKKAKASARAKALDQMRLLRPLRPASRWVWWKGVILRGAVGAVIMGCLTGAVVLGVYSQLAKGYDLAELGEMPERTVVVDSKGQVLGRLHGEDRIVVSLAEVSPWFIKALLAREDSRFYRHSGIDFIGVGRAMIRNLKDRRIVQGASTLTMQLARNSYPDLDERSFHRKLLEMMLARRIEKVVGKDQILEHYINRIFFGPGLWGIQRASQVYFGKHASQLTLSESALIAGLIRSPSRFSPFRNFEGAVKERDDVLRRLVVLGAISPAEEIAAKYEEVILQARPAFQSQGGFALDLVKRDLDLILEQKDLREGGLRVVTTLDKDLNDMAETALDKRLREVEQTPGYAHRTKADYDEAWDMATTVVEIPYLQGSISVLNNETGGVLAVVGGRDYRQSKFNRATNGSRQIGSIVKPFVYAAGIQAGWMPGTLVSDDPLQPGEIFGADATWNPGNSDGRFTGLQPLAKGLVQSRNTMTIRVGNHAGMDRVRQILSDVGLPTGQQSSPQIFIGNLAGNAYQVATAFSVFPNEGLRKRPYLIDQILDKKGQVLFKTGVMEVDTLSPGIAHVINRMLAQVVDQGTAAVLRTEYGFDQPAGGKTGTTNQYRDAWFAGYTPRVTAAVWVGFDRATTIVDDGYGGKLALPIWADVMNRAVELGYTHDSSMPEPPMSRVALCRHSSALATQGCRAEGCAYEDELPYELVPGYFCHLHGGAEAGTTPEKKGQSVWQRMRRWFD
jgi:penicillin-binding protein 1A